jgi:hypothetical protein
MISLAQVYGQWRALVNVSSGSVGKLLTVVRMGSAPCSKYLSLTDLGESFR